MSESAFFLWIFISLLQAFAAALPSNAPPSPERTFINQLPASRKFSSVRQIKNPKWTNRQVSTTEVYAAPFLKHNIPMPDKLLAALQNPPTQRDLDHMSPLERRANGQTVSGSNGE